MKHSVEETAKVVDEWLHGSQSTLEIGQSIG